MNVKKLIISGAIALTVLLSVAGIVGGLYIKNKAKTQSDEKEKIALETENLKADEIPAEDKNTLKKKKKRPAFSMFNRPKKAGETENGEGEHRMPTMEEIDQSISEGLAEWRKLPAEEQEKMLKEINAQLAMAKSMIPFMEPEMKEGMKQAMGEIRLVSDMAFTSLHTHMTATETEQFTPIINTVKELLNQVEAQ